MIIFLTCLVIKLLFIYYCFGIIVYFIFKNKIKNKNLNAIPKLKKYKIEGTKSKPMNWR